MSTDPPPHPAPHPIPGAGVVCVRGNEVLLIRRGTPPKQGEWSLPGGKIQLGETAKAAALRELAEETGVVAEIVGLVDVVDLIIPEREPGGGAIERHYVLVDFAARWLSGEPRAGDDAAEARFVPLREAAALVAWDETRRVIAEGAELVARAAAQA